jgi:hypothetical protein
MWGAVQWPFKLELPLLDWWRSFRNSQGETYQTMASLWSPTRSPPPNLACTCCLYGAVRNGFEAGKIHYEGHWMGRALEIKSFLGPEMATSLKTIKYKLYIKKRYIGNFNGIWIFIYIFFNKLTGWVLLLQDMGKGLGCGRTLEVLDRVPMLTIHLILFHLDKINDTWINRKTREIHGIRWQNIYWKD